MKKMTSIGDGSCLQQVGKYDKLLKTGIVLFCMLLLKAQWDILGLFECNNFDVPGTYQRRKNTVSILGYTTSVSKNAQGVYQGVYDIVFICK